MTVYEVPSYLHDENLVACMFPFRDISSHDRMQKAWRFDIMLDNKTFSISNWLDLKQRRLSVIAIRKPIYWDCGEIGYLSASYP